MQQCWPEDGAVNVICFWWACAREDRAETHLAQTDYELMGDWAL